MLTRGTRIGRYEVTALVGTGGMAAVYRVRHVELGSEHALKLLSVHRDRVRERLLQEGQAQAQVAHPNVVRVTDVLTYDDAPVLVMEYVDGPPIDRWLGAGRPSLGEALDVAAGIARGLRAAHARGLVHRDLKPANVLLARTPDGRPLPKIADFGLVKVIVEDGAGRSFTRSGSALGTPEFMAPEQMRDASRVDPRADLYSFGCLLYALVCGRLPFVGTDLLQLHRQILAGRYLPPDTIVPGVPHALQELIAALLRPTPEERPQTCDAVLAVLESVDVRLPAGVGTASPTELQALVRAPSDALDALCGRGPRAALGAAPTRRTFAAAGLVIPVLAAALGLVVPDLPPPIQAAPSLPAPTPFAPVVVPPVAVPLPHPTTAQVKDPVAAPPAAPLELVRPPDPPSPTPVAPLPQVARQPVTLRGDATRVWLVRKGRRIDVPGPVAPGLYEIVALFKGTEPVTAGTVEVGASPVALRCSAFAMRCRPDSS